MMWNLVISSSNTEKQHNRQVWWIHGLGLAVVYQLIGFRNIVLMGCGKKSIWLTIILTRQKQSGAKTLVYMDICRIKNIIFTSGRKAQRFKQVKCWGGFFGFFYRCSNDQLCYIVVNPTLIIQRGVWLPWKAERCLKQILPEFPFFYLLHFLSKSTHWKNKNKTKKCLEKILLDKQKTKILGNWTQYYEDLFSLQILIYNAII